MANWEKLNKEFDDALDSMTKEDWDNWYENVEQKRINQNKMIKETLEQIAEKYSQRSNATVFKEAHKQDFIAGAEWQSKKMYTEFEVLQLLLKFHQTESYDNLYDWFQQNKKKTNNNERENNFT